MTTPSGESDRDRILAKVKPEFHEAFLQFIRTGKSSPEFEAYHDSSIECQEAVCDAFAMQAKIFQEIVNREPIPPTSPTKKLNSKTLSYLLAWSFGLLCGYMICFGLYSWAASEISSARELNYQFKRIPPWYETEVRFSPHGGCSNEIIRAIGTAKKQIRIFSYSFTSESIAQALILQQMGGIDVQIVIDSGSAKHSEVENLASNGVKVWIDSAHAIMHSKVVIIDDELVLTGSYNFSDAAEVRNHENLITIRSENVAEKYLEEWEKHRKHSKKKEKW